MIYKIDNSNITEARIEGASVICWSFDGKFVLVKSETQIKNYIEMYEDESLKELMSLPLWNQPCPGCNL